MGLRWEGDKVKAMMESASRVGINKTMALCVGGAKEDHPFTNRTGTAEQSIRIAAAAESWGDKTRGIWGSVMNSYFKYLELGTSRMRQKSALPSAFGRKKYAIEGSSKGAPPWLGGSYAPTLVPEARKFYPGLPYLIEAAFMRGLW